MQTQKNRSVSDHDYEVSKKKFVLTFRIDVYLFMRLEQTISVWCLSLLKRENTVTVDKQVTRIYTFSNDERH